MNLEDPNTDPVRDTSDRGELASIQQRAAARLIDWILLIGIWMILLVGGGTVTNEPDSIPTWIVLTWMAVITAYETLLVALRGQTAGKWVMNIRVASVADGQNPPMIRAFLRVAPVVAVVAVAGNLFPLLLVFLYYTAGFATDSFRGLIDRLAGTVVVRS